MRYRPRSSVTTILANFVGRSLVSAITHTPASGPFELVTTPPMSSASIATAAPLLCCASTPVKEAARTHITANEPILGFTRHFILCPPCNARQHPCAQFHPEFPFCFPYRENYTP